MSEPNEAASGHRRVAPFGEWPSPIDAAMVANAGVSLSELALSGDVVWWIEGRPTEGGRRVIVRASPLSEPLDVTPPSFNARTTVHEYGGGSYWTHGERVFFVNLADQRIYRQDDPWSDPVPITPESDGRARYADGRALPDGEAVVCVRERHGAEGVVNELVAVPADGSSEPWVIVDGRDFYAYPRPDPTGRRMAWTCWDHPQMPWDGEELWVADIDDRARPTGARRVAGGPEESAQQPVWSPGGELHFVSDRTGWWNLYRWDGQRSHALAPKEAEFGGPQWVFGLSYYGFLDDGRIACAYAVDGRIGFAVLDPGSSELLELDLPYTAAPAGTPTLVAEGGRIALIAGAATMPPSVVSLDFTSRAVDVLREGGSRLPGEVAVSVPRHIEFPTDGGRAGYAWVYEPSNPRAAGPEDERPPLLVVGHGGPTGSSSSVLDLAVQFWTSRGFAVVAVDYGGSTGYGREYRERLTGGWGIVDVADCVAAARFLADAGAVDGGRMVIRGGSAGGYTALCALVFHPGVFAAAASYYGVADAEALARETHKFESRYLDKLIGPYPERADVYRARSPIHFTDRLSCPVILFQGMQDEVVPPAQAEAMAASLDAKGLPYAYITFEDEQHGIRKAENVRRALEAELFFYGSVLGFSPADELQPIEIHNPPSSAV